MSLQFYDLQPSIEDFRVAVLHGLSQPQKAIPAKFLYDQRGAQLFEAICELDEYYLTRTELAILQANASEIAALIGDGALIEFGSGNSQKVKILLDKIPQPATYVALDISKEQLRSSCQQLVDRDAQLNTIAICADYTQPLQLPELVQQYKHKVGFFPGSSIGNFEPEEVVQFLRNAANLLQPQGHFLIGVDLKKSKDILEPAYDDAQGISAAFALNLLTRINHELSADFNPDNFGYRAFYNPIGRIEMYLVSLKQQTVHLNNASIAFEMGETLYTEKSYKYSIAEFQELAALAGFQPKQVWTDSQNLFSLHYLYLP